MTHELYLAEIIHGDITYSKIGISKCSKCRLSQHTTKGHMKGSVGRLVLIYELPERLYAEVLESACKSSLASRFECLKGSEWFKAPIEEAKEVVERIYSRMKNAGTFQ